METASGGTRDAAPEETWADIGAHGFWRQGTTALFDIRIVNLDAGSNLRRTPEKDLVKAEKEKKDKYLQPCLESRRNFTPLVFSADRTPGAEAWAATLRIALHLGFNMKREYSEICGFVGARMALAIVRSNTLLLQGTRDNEACIRQ